MKQILRTAVVQHRCGDDPRENLERSIHGIREAAEQDAAIALLPELHRLPYFCITEDETRFDFAETIPGETTETLGRLAKETGMVIIASIFEKRAKGIYHNTATVVDRDGGIAGTYRKMHIPDDPGFYEKFYFTPGDQGFSPIETSLGKLGVLVCWDQWFPEAARIMALAGAECLFYPSAIGWDNTDDEDEKKRQLDAWVTIQQSHAIANNLPVIVSNRVGNEPDPSGRTGGTEFWGSSFIAGPQGEILVRAPTDSESVIYADIDKNRTEDLRRIWPYFRDRRIDAYQDISKRIIE